MYRRYSPMSDDMAAKIDRWGGPTASFWANQARRYVMFNDTTRARAGAMCLLRCVRAARNYGSDPLDDTLPRELVHPSFSDARRVLPSVAVRELIDRYVAWSTTDAVRREWADVMAADRRRRQSYAAGEIRRFVRRNRRNRMTAAQRRAEAKAERLCATIRGELAVDRARHPAAHIIQQQDDTEARAVGDRVY